MASKSVHPINVGISMFVSFISGKTKINLISLLIMLIIYSKRQSRNNRDRSQVGIISHRQNEAKIFDFSLG